jgi:imidazolonepropionase-like amidohydrolase
VSDWQGCGRPGSGRRLAHCRGGAGLAIAASASVGSIEHGFAVRREILARMRKNDMAWTPSPCPVHLLGRRVGAGVPLAARVAPATGTSLS